MKLSRFQKYCFTLSAFCFLTFLAGCATTWVSESINIIDMIVPAVGAILALVGALSGKVTAGDITLLTSGAEQVTNDLNNVILPLINSYNAAAATAQPGILSQIQSGLQAVIANFSGVLSALHISDAATQAKVEAVANLVLSEIQSLMELIPALKAAAVRGDSDLGGVLKELASQGKVLPLRADQFKHHFNSVMRAKTGDPSVDSVTPKFVLK